MTYAYDAFGRLAEVKNNGSVFADAQALYDPQDRGPQKYNAGR